MVKKSVKQEKKLLKPTPKLNKIVPERIMQTREIDASGKVLGRLATEVANILRGKDKPAYRPYKIVGDKVVIVNASKIVLTGKKIEQKVYQRHTGYLGHLKTVTAKELMVKNPGQIILNAVYGMLPKNKLRDQLMKNLTIKN